MIMTKKEIQNALYSMYDQYAIQKGFLASEIHTRRIISCTYAYMDVLEGLIRYVNENDDDACIALIDHVHKTVIHLEKLMRLIYNTDTGWSIFAMYSCMISLLDILDLL